MYFRYILLILITLFYSCSSDDDNGGPLPINCLDGQGLVVMETRSVQNFHSINNTVFADIFISQGPQEDLVIEAQQNILAELETLVVNNELIITVKRCVDIDQAIKIYITVPDIRNLKLNGVGEIVSQNDFNIPSLNVVLAGAGNFTLDGTVNDLNIELDGVGNVMAFQLESNNCDVSIAGVGDVEVFVNDELNVVITGSGIVYYKGNPIINSNITGTGSVVDSN